MINILTNLKNDVSIIIVITHIMLLVITMNEEREVRDMAVLSKPINLTFEVSEKKAELFLKNSKISMLDKALARASAHESKRKNNKEK